MRASATTKVALLTGMCGIALGAGAYVAALPWLRAYQVSGAAWLLALCTVVPMLISAAFTRALRFHALVSLAASFAGLVITTWAASGFDISRAWDGTVHVPAQLLTETLPLGGSAYLLAAPMVLTWGCAFFCAEALLRGRSPSALPLAGPPAYFALSFAATTSAPPGPTAAEAAGLLGVMGAVALARHALGELQRQHLAESSPVTAANRAEPARTGADRVPSTPHGHGWKVAGWHAGGSAADANDRARVPRHTTLRRAAGGAAGCGLVAAGLGLGLPHFGPLASRPVAVSRPTQTLGGTIVDPVGTLAAVRTTHLWGRPVPMFAVTVSAPWDGYLPVAVMSTYDGGSWSFAPVFRPTGGRVPAIELLPGELVRQTFALERPLPLPLLPALERPIDVSGASVDADSASGMVAASGQMPGIYQVVSKATGFSTAQLPLATPLTQAADLPGGEGRQLTQVPSGSQRFLTPAVHYAVELTGQPATPTFSFLEALSSALRAHEKWAVPAKAQGSSLPAALTGTSLAQVMNAVTVDRAATPEQFATFLAVVGRDLGVPVRLVSGFRATPSKRPGSGHGASGEDGSEMPGELAAGTYRVMAADAWTWDEIPLAGRGWVVLDPTPSATTTNVSAPPEQVQPAKPHKPKPATALPSQPTSRALAHPVKLSRPDRDHTDWALTLGAGLPALILVALGIVLLGIPAVKRRLRRLGRQQGNDPTLLAAGAWLELVDNLARLGMQVPASATSRDIAEQVSSHFGEQFGPPVMALGSLADQAICSTRYPVGVEEARTAWHSQRSLCRAVRSHQPYRDRARSLLSVGPSPSRPLSVSAHQMDAHR